MTTKLCPITECDKCPFAEHDYTLWCGHPAMCRGWCFVCPSTGIRPDCPLADAPEVKP